MLEKWKGALFNTRIDQVTKAQIAAYRDARLVEGMAPRTINIHLSILRHVFAKAVNDGIIEKLPPFGRFKNSVAQAPSRPRLTDEEFEMLCRAALEESGRNGQLLHDLLRFLGYSGARKTEAQQMLWRDVDFKGDRITFRSTKGGVTRSMDMNPSLKNHLAEMWERRDPESSYLFPSLERGSRDEPVSNLEQFTKNYSRGF
ncbi:MAG: tyrosine-type recombinase/integrase [Verrucomicrobiota bacterium]